MMILNSTSKYLGIHSSDYNVGDSDGSIDSSSMWFGGPIRSPPIVLPGGCHCVC